MNNFRLSDLTGEDLKFKMLFKNINFSMTYPCSLKVLFKLFSVKNRKWVVSNIPASR